MSDAGAFQPGQLSPDGLWRWDGLQWTPVAAPAVPGWLKLSLRRQATWWTVASAVLVGALADQALHAGAFGAGAAATVIASAVVLVVAGRIRRTQPLVLAGVAILFGVWLVLRASPWLVWPDLAAGLAILFLAASLSENGSMFDIGSAELSARGIHALAHLVAGVTFVARPALATRARLSRLAPVARGLLIAAPICALISVLLASADPVFASFFNLNLDLGDLVVHITLVVICALVMAGLMRLAFAEPVGRIEGPVWRLGSTEALVVLALLDAVFAAFAIAQVLAATGAAADTLKAAGITYSDYARSGFFQLLWAGGITLVVLILFSRITGLSTPEHKLAFLVLAEIAVALTLMIVIVAFRRLSLYEDAYGFTMLRLYSHVFAGWMAVVFVLLASELMGLWRGRRWFVGATLTTALAVLLGLNVLNPEATIVALNVSHAQTAHEVDASYLGGLSSDATPSLLSSLPAFDTTLRKQVAGVACTGARSYSPSVWAFNWSDESAAAARGAACR